MVSKAGTMYLVKSIDTMVGSRAEATIGCPPERTKQSRGKTFFQIEKLNNNYAMSRSYGRAKHLLIRAKIFDLTEAPKIGLAQRVGLYHRIKRSFADTTPYWLSC
jgi:hypothetical protein